MRCGPGSTGSGAFGPESGSESTVATAHRSSSVLEDAEDELPELMSSYGDILDRSAVVFSPPGYGYNCTRHAEAWAHGCVLLAPRLHERFWSKHPRCGSRNRCTSATNGT